MPKTAKTKSSEIDRSPQKRAREAATGRFEVKRDESSHAMKRDAKSGRVVEASFHNWAGSVLARVRAMSNEQKIQSLKDAGILTKSGNLARPYRD